MFACGVAFDRYNFTSGGALGSLTLGLCVKELWARGMPAVFAIPETNHEYTRSVSLMPIFCCDFLATYHSAVHLTHACC